MFGLPQKDFNGLKWTGLLPVHFFVHYGLFKYHELQSPEKETLRPGVEFRISDQSCRQSE